MSSEPKSVDDAANEYVLQPRCAQVRAGTKDFYRLKAAFLAGLEHGRRLEREWAEKLVQALEDIVNLDGKARDLGIDKAIAETLLEYWRKAHE